MRLFEYEDKKIAELREGNMTVIGKALDHMALDGVSGEERRQLAEATKSLLKSYTELEVSDSRLAYVSGMAAGVVITVALVIAAVALKYGINLLFA